MRATFSIDQTTDAALRRSAEALRVSKSEVVRRAVIDFEARRDRLSEAERAQFLATLDEWLANPPSRSAADARNEVREIRAARRQAGRRRS